MDGDAARGRDGWSVRFFGGLPRVFARRLARPGAYFRHPSGVKNPPRTRRFSRLALQRRKVPEALRSGTFAPLRLGERPFPSEWAAKPQGSLASDTDALQSLAPEVLGTHSVGEGFLVNLQMACSEVDRPACGTQDDGKKSRLRHLLSPAAI